MSAKQCERSAGRIVQRQRPVQRRRFTCSLRSRSHRDDRGPIGLAVFLRRDRVALHGDLWQLGACRLQPVVPWPTTTPSRPGSIWSRIALALPAKWGAVWSACRSTAVSVVVSRIWGRPRRRRDVLIGAPWRGPCPKEGSRSPPASTQAPRASTSEVSEAGVPPTASNRAPAGGYLGGRRGPDRRRVSHSPRVSPPRSAAARRGTRPAGAIVPLALVRSCARPLVPSPAPGRLRSRRPARGAASSPAWRAPPDAT
jgi:hypothetical protein